MISRQTATARAPRTQERTQREVDDLRLVIKARNGDDPALEALMRRYTGFVRLKASSYFLAGGDPDDLIQEGLVGLYKAVRDFRTDKETSFRSFAEICITRQIITAIKAATRFKHAPLNTYVSFSQTPAGQDDGECTVGDALSGPPLTIRRSVSSRPRSSRALCSRWEPVCRSSRVMRCASTSEGLSYEEMADELGCDTKTIDNALQRVKRKVLVHQRDRQVMD